MIKTILLVIDGQPINHPSIELALRWSKECSAQLVGMGVIDEWVVHPAEAVPLGAGQAKVEWDADRLRRQQLAIESCLSALSACCAREGIAFQQVERLGEPAEEITVAAQRFDLIVMPRAADSENGAVEESIGRALSAILRTGPRPVIAVPKHVTPGDAVVIAYDGSLQAARTLQLFEATGLAATRSVHVVSVDDDPLEAARRGNRAVDFLAHHGIQAALRAETRTRDPSEHILGFARQLQAGLLVMGAYGQPRIREFVLGSVTRSVLENCSIPLFLYH
jgi:nucleotide-binding universal stress UspA family protein